MRADPVQIPTENLNLNFLGLVQSGSLPNMEIAVFG